ncbi:uncharacterized protein LOC127796938 [Diospyros lotus]|uniref:uncharacterized protein LOC127796938 n=1 Tax=Diospyros lotus TaxID=55363 RepID=UPI00224DC12A|nr:uncharacterized protein LOC127796938 [Diospyros lotus]
MCPLRLILIFLSATLAGFLVLKNLKFQPQTPKEQSPNPPSESLSTSSRVRGAIVMAFWVCLDMASGRYLWRNLVSSPSLSSSPSQSSIKRCS